ncbi:16S rRNA (guanine(966)-N(2))-methyltransferase RsmD [bacterium]|nr:16S rRNA (guanine(966)-N(2))-methyltransferase RsmD [bacterium]
MRIISGKYGGVRILSKASLVRPTSDMVREALFNILGDIEGVSFLDLYAGFGTVGLEALSRGASHITFVEINRINCQKINQNIQNLGAPTALVDIITMGALEALGLFEKRNKQFDLIFADPPYHQGEIPKLLLHLEKLKKNLVRGYFILQASAREKIPAEPWEDIRKYGNTRLYFLKSEQL